MCSPPDCCKSSSYWSSSEACWHLQVGNSLLYCIATIKNEVNIILHERVCLNTFLFRSVQLYSLFYWGFGLFSVWKDKRFPIFPLTGCYNIFLKSFKIIWDVVFIRSCRKCFLFLFVITVTGCLYPFSLFVSLFFFSFFLSLFSFLHTLSLNLPLLGKKKIQSD